MSVIAESNALEWAAWNSLDTGIVAFAHDWSDPAPPPLFWGEARVPLRRVRAMRPTEFALHSSYCIDGDRVWFILNEAQFPRRAVYLAASFNGWADAIGKPAWRLRRRTIEGQRVLALSISRDDIPSEQPAYFKFVTGDDHWLPVREDAPNLQLDGLGFNNYVLSPWQSGRHWFEVTFPVPLTQSEGRKVYFTKDAAHADGVRLRPGVFIKSLQTEQRLGAWIEDGDTQFALFAPRARRVELFLYESLDDRDAEPIALQLGPELVWQVALQGDYRYWFYHYKIHGGSPEDGGGFNHHVAVVDPYAKAMASAAGPGIIVPPEDLVNPYPVFTPSAWHDLVIAECHVRDLLAKAPIALAAAERLGFNGLRKLLNQSDNYLHALGVNAIELQPIQQFDEADPSNYAWGYMPVNYFAPASQYASNPHSGAQIKEFRDLVHTLHQANLTVIVDVVYNHVGEPNFLQFIDKSYFFLLTPDGQYENHSGCGNTLDCSAPMVRRLILDSLRHLIECFDVDGFRFDLGELITKDTLAWLEPQLKAIKPGVVLIAEPWSFRSHIGEALKETGFASWNDGYREEVRKYLLNLAPAATLRHFLLGSQSNWSRFPAQTVNYLESHDDRCWIDKITENPGHNGDWPTATDRRRSHLMIATLMSSLGIPMILAGLDMLKSKGGVHNTYQRGDLNAIDLDRALRFPATVAYVRSWIRFRLSPPARLLRLHEFPSPDFFACAEADNALAVAFNADQSHGPQRIVFAINPSFDPCHLKFDAPVLRSLRQIADSERFDPHGLRDPIYNTSPNSIDLPPLSCGLWIHIPPPIK